MTRELSDTAKQALAQAVPRKMPGEALADPPAPPSWELSIEQRLDRIERKLDWLLNRPSP